MVRSYSHFSSANRSAYGALLFYALHHDEWRIAKKSWGLQVLHEAFPELNEIEPKILLLCNAESIYFVKLHFPVGDKRPVRSAINQIVTLHMDFDTAKVTGLEERKKLTADMGVEIFNPDVLKHTFEFGFKRCVDRVKGN